MEEVKEFIITADSSAEIREEAIRSLLTNGIDRLQFQSIATMPLTEDEVSQTVRTFVVDGNTVTVTEDAYIAFVDDYFRIKAETEEEFFQRVLNDKYTAESAMQESWEAAGYEWPFKNN